MCVSVRPRQHVWMGGDCRAFDTTARWSPHALPDADGTHCTSCYLLLHSHRTALHCTALQCIRDDRLVVLLAALLRRYVEGDREGFEVRLRAPVCVHVLAFAACSCSLSTFALHAPVWMHPMQASMAVEAAELATASFGDVMLKAIGSVYKAGGAAAARVLALHRTCGTACQRLLPPCRRLITAAYAVCATLDCRLSRTLRWAASSMATWHR